MIEEWRDFLVYIDPDMTTGYNIHWFDWPYLNTRMELLSRFSRFFYLSQLIRYCCVMEEKEFSSKAHGSSTSKKIHMPGRVDMDLYTYIKRNYKLKSYKLGRVSQHFLKNDKVDLGIPEMNDNHRSGDPTRQAKNVEYCVKDTELPILLWENQYILESIVEMSRVTCVFMKDLFARGQMFKVVSQLYIKGRRRGFALTTFEPNPDAKGYKGATVLEIKDGYYELVVVLDFASLYPSIMKAKNLCYTSLVTDDKQYGNLQHLGYTYYNCETSAGPSRFQQTLKGLLPIIIDELLTSRSQAKKLMKSATEAGDTALSTIYNARQLALKISCNSIYGFTGAMQSKYCCPQIASTVTFYGRELIESTKNIIETRYEEQGADVIYGDSVTGDTPILIRLVDGSTDLVEIQDLDVQYHQQGEKQVSSSTGLQVWSDEGWTDIVRVIRHRTVKKILRVLTSTGVVDCTEDHSLLTPDAVRVKPADLKVGDELLHHHLPFLPLSPEHLPFPISPDMAFVIGVFMRDGSCEIFTINNEDGSGLSWVINSANYELLKACQQVLCSAGFGIRFEILGAATNGGAFGLVPVGGGDKDVCGLVMHFRDMCYYKQAKIVPLAILKSGVSIRLAFFRGYCAADDVRSSNHILPTDKSFKIFDVENKITASSFYILTKSLLYHCSIDTVLDDVDTYRITITKSKQRRPSTAIKKIQELQQKAEFVYDLETKTHHFSAGIGEMVVHNTDSVMVVFNNIEPDQMGFEKVFDIGHEAAAFVSDSFEEAITLEMEKVYRPALMQVKKHYAALAFETKTDPGKIDAKGIALVRRDFCDYHQEAYGAILRVLLYERDMEKGLRVLTEHLDNLAKQSVKFESLVLSRQLAKEYKNPNICQKIVADKIEVRMPGSGPKSGDRVDFVVIVIPSHNDKAPLYRKVEDAEYAKLNNLQLDLKYYVKAFNPCMTSLFKPFKINRRLGAIFSRFIGQAHRISNGNTNILSFFTKTSSSQRRIQQAEEPKEEEVREEKHRQSLFAAKPRAPSKTTANHDRSSIFKASGKTRQSKDTSSWPCKKTKKVSMFQPKGSQNPKNTKKSNYALV